MDSLKIRLKRLEYHQSLMLEMINPNEKPFNYLIIKAGLHEEDTNKIVEHCEELSKKYEKQKAEGFVVFTQLLTEFANMLSPNLELEGTIEALLKQNMFIPLMNEFKKLLRK